MSTCTAGRTEGTIGGPGWVTATCSDCGWRKRVWGWTDRRHDKAWRILKRHQGEDA